MSYIIVGLGNPGEEYKETRHNTGRIIAEGVAKICEANDFSFDKKLSSLKTKIDIEGKSAVLLLPETFMNKSGASLKPLLLSEKAKEQVVVIHDDLDLPFGKIRVAFDRGSGGHRGIDSIEKVLKTRKFLRIRVGISGVTPSGKTKKPKGEEKVVKCILGKFKPEELKELKKLSKKIKEVLEVLVLEGKAKAMTLYNAG